MNDKVFHKRLDDKSFRRADELHAAHHKTFRVDRQAHGVADERHRHDEQHQSDKQQNSSYLIDILIDRVYQRLLHIHLFHVFVLQNPLLDLRYAVVVGIIRLKPHVDRRQKRVFDIAEPLKDVLAKVFGQTARRLFLRDVFGRLHIFFLIQKTLKINDIALLDTFFHHNLEADIFLDVFRNLIREKHQRREQTQHKKHEHDAHQGDEIRAAQTAFR